VLSRTLGTSPVAVRGAMVPADRAHGYQLPHHNPPDRTRPTQPGTARGGRVLLLSAPTGTKRRSPRGVAASYRHVPIKR